MRTDPWVFRSLVLISALAAACVDDGDDNEGDGELEEGTVSSEISVLGTYQVTGQRLTVSQLDPIHHQTSRITSCGQGVLYSTRVDDFAVTLWVNLKGGYGAWTQVSAGTKGSRIACDRRHLYSLSNTGALFHAVTRSDGQLNPTTTGGSVFWTSTYGSKTLTVPTGTTDIQGGMGNIYALAFDSTTQIGTLYASQLKNPSSAAGYVQGSSGTWVQLANNLGTDQATGAGSKVMHTTTTTSLGYRKTNRAFGANPNDTLYFNDQLLYGINSWTSIPTAGIAIQSITADDSNTLYAMGQQGLGKRLVRFSFVESNCTDNLDNDANGEIDAEDPSCRAALATAWCQTNTSGRYCIDRIRNTNNYSHALVTCNGAGTQPTIQAGRCTKAIFGSDFLTAPRATSEPAGTGRYCNVIKSDNTWDFSYAGSTPCATLLARHPGATIVRAGLYSTTGTNSVHVRCSNGGVTFEDTGTTALASAYDGVGHTANRCVFTVSPKQMQVFNAPFPTSAWAAVSSGGRGYVVGHVFDHVPLCQAGDPGCPCTTASCPVSLSQFGNGDNFSTNVLDNRGKSAHANYNEQRSYDYLLDEGTPLRSLGYGKVVSSRERDLSTLLTSGTTYQGEIYIRYDVGSDPIYQESFIAYYAHVGTRSVVTGQTVAPGQLIGYVGTTGASSDPHLHFGITRLSNTNGRTVAGGDRFGYRVPFAAVTTTDQGVNHESLPFQIDPYGWRAPSGIDPMGFRWSKAASGLAGVTGIGAWSPQLWLPNEVPPYPTP